jgi:hypothetical protein
MGKELRVYRHKSSKYQLDVADHESLKKILNQAILNYNKYINKSMIEIKDLRREVGELQWTNRELKMSVNEKSA